MGWLEEVKYTQLQIKDGLQINHQFRDTRGLARLALTGMALGCIIGGGLCFSILTQGPHWRFALWIASMALFHLMEFLSTAFGHPDTANAKAFDMAMKGAIAEYWIESFLFPNLKSNILIVSLMGIAAVLVGQLVRSLAMWTLGVSFTHLLAKSKTVEHKLGTRGIYAYMRHPSYAGWFWWAVGSQCILANPICILGFAGAAAKFFLDRIPEEEEDLEAFFGRQYSDYKQRVPMGFPLDVTFRLLSSKGERS